jgi:hypothetical protein
LRNSVFPKNPKDYQGFFFVRLIAFAYLLVVVTRSAIHLFTADGGAESIAGIDTSGPGGNNVIAIFHQWGAIQLLLAALMLVLFFTYKGLTPLVILFLACDAPMRALAGQMSELETSHTPPGEALNWPVFWFLVVLFITSLIKRRPKS